MPDWLNSIVTWLQAHWDVLFTTLLSGGGVTLLGFLGNRLWRRRKEEEEAPVTYQANPEIHQIGNSSHTYQFTGLIAGGVHLGATDIGRTHDPIQKVTLGLIIRIHSQTRQLIENISREVGEVQDWTSPSGLSDHPQQPFNFTISEAQHNVMKWKARLAEWNVIKDSYGQHLKDELITLDGYIFELECLLTSWDGHS